MRSDKEPIRKRGRVAVALVCVALLAVGIAVPLGVFLRPSSSCEDYTGPLDENTIAVFGSSVSNGFMCSGNCSGRARSSLSSQEADLGGCYQSRLRVWQREHSGRSVFNNANNGDSTAKLLRRFCQVLSSRARYVLFGLSLSNEAKRMGASEVTREVFDAYHDGLVQLADRTRTAGGYPVIGSCYPRSSGGGGEVTGIAMGGGVGLLTAVVIAFFMWLEYTADEYALIREMNVLTQTSEALGQPPGVNYLGALDDGHGRIVEGFFADGGHPNDAGSTEMWLAIVPSLFDAINAGKPSRVARQDASGSTGFVSEGSERRVAFTVPADQPMHSFTFAFAFRCSTDCIGASVASVSQAPVAPQSARAAVSAPHPLPVAPPSDLKIGIDASGQLSTTDERSGIVAAAGPSLTDGDWHYVAVSHYYANASTNYYVDGQIVLQTLERRVPSDFVLACSSSAALSCEYRDMLIYRSASNGDEVAFLADDTRPTVLQASLEVYAPLTNSSHLAANLAQSLSEVILDG
ncbi:hypothetical protein EMIHUDRAFT_194099 [Emiliania huxleyi CCMP1516]|uniref:Laminin G domain-containing protein n=2 Tax=Emiliania huxleyi TaxID=2903 RepID=A0A0D3L0Z0_EMIH1|nr:hypothetical protein EMIHUDRAFT_194099 [Emiliania huxleyi CCMP1516]EOD41675.1 hypothetical protein EMIHUDRAFT_194099 [Emiliania huxleyi CCMP1516]|eukprot:XP_005794104.1 hypothetical protein EMIHUDRAFT_194099 [Emiliania huxleyi CCMP1516]